MRENGWETTEDIDAALTLFSGWTNIPSKSRREKILTVPNGAPTDVAPLVGHHPKWYSTAQDRLCRITARSAR